MRNKFSTDLQIKALEPKENQYEVYDAKARGLAVRVSPGGRKTFTLVYRQHGRKVRVTFGAYPDMSLAEARKAALTVNSKVANGHDPKAGENRQKKDNESLFQVVATEFIELHAKPNTKTWRETERILINQIGPHLDRRPLRQIEKKRIGEILYDIGDRSGPSAANHAFAELRRLFNWCVGRGHLDFSPCNGMKKPFKGRERERVLSDHELGRILASLSQFGHPYEPFSKLLAFTGQRRSEVARMKWSHIDFEAKTWTQPQGSNKSGRTHIVPLSNPCVELLRSLPRFDSEYVFPARGRFDSAISGYSKWKGKLDKLSGIENWVLHDLRRTAATRMAELQVPIHVIELILNHRSSKLSGVAGIYNKHGYLEDQRVALQRWADHVDAILPRVASPEERPEAKPLGPVEQSHSDGH